MTAALIIARAAYFAAAMLLFGATALRYLMRARLPHIAPPPLAALRGAGLAIAAIAALAWFVLAAAAMAGDAGAATDAAVLRAAAFHTIFGMGFLARMGALILVGIALALRWEPAALALSAIALAAPALSSHAAASSPAPFTAIGVCTDALHLLTAGFWIGGLALLALLFMRRPASADLLLTLSLFSEWAMIAVLLLAMSGLINALMVLLGGPGHDAPLYLAVLGAKLAAVLAMLTMAAINRFRLMPSFTDPMAQARLGRHVWLELGLGIAAAALAGWLGQLAPTLG